MVKPTGKIGATQVSTATGQVAEVTFDHIQFPTEKSAVERHVAESFIASYAQFSGDDQFLREPQLNQENDFDLTVESNGSPAYLELMELRPAKGRYTDEQQIKLDVGKYVDWVLTEIRRKSSKYPRNLRQPLFLLLYVTHWAYLPSQSVIRLLQVELIKYRWVFNAIFLYIPLDSASGAPYWLYPTPHKVRRGIFVEELRGRTYFNLNPSFAKAIKGGAMLKIDLTK